MPGPTNALATTPPAPRQHTRYQEHHVSDRTNAHRPPADDRDPAAQGYLQHMAYCPDDASLARGLPLGPHEGGRAA